MRKSLVQTGWSIILSWAIMFLAFLIQMNLAAQTHFESTPISPLSVTVMAILLGAGLMITAIGYTID